MDRFWNRSPVDRSPPESWIVLESSGPRSGRRTHCSSTVPRPRSNKRLLEMRQAERQIREFLLIRSSSVSPMMDDLCWRHTDRYSQAYTQRDLHGNIQIHAYTEQMAV